MAIGWIKLHRQIQENDLWDSSDEPFDKKSAWIDLLLLANHKDKDVLIGNRKITVKAGQKMTSLVKLAERWNWSRDRVRRYLDLLVSLGMIVRESDNEKTVITIVNYSKYQGDDADDNTANNTANDTANRHPIIQQTDTQQDSEQYSEQYTNKNDKNDKNEIRMKKNDKNEKKSEYGEYSHVRLTDLEHERLLNDFGAEMTTALIKFLDEYIERKGYKAKSHYLCLRGWVLDAVNERKGKQTPQTKGAQEMDAAYQMMKEWRAKHDNG